MIKCLLKFGFRFATIATFAMLPITNLSIAKEEPYFDLPKKDPKEQCEEVARVYKECNNISDNFQKCGNVHVKEVHFYGNEGSDGQIEGPGIVVKDARSNYIGTSFWGNDGFYVTEDYYEFFLVKKRTDIKDYNGLFFFTITNCLILPSSKNIFLKYDNKN